jgi:hypothetical protein
MKFKSIILIAIVGFAFGARGQVQVRPQIFQAVNGKLNVATAAESVAESEPKGVTAQEEAAPTANEDQIRFFNENVLNGSVVSLVPGDGLRFKSPEAADEITFSLANLAAVEFVKTGKSPAHSPHSLTLVNGNVLSGRILSLSDNSFTVETATAGTIAVKREMVATIAAQKNSSEFNYTGPNSLEEWEVHSGNWTFKDGVLIGEQNGARIGKNVTLPEKVRFDFEMAWRGNGNYQVAFLSDSTDLSQAKDMACVNISQTYINFYSRKGGAERGFANLQMRELAGKNQARLTLLMDRKTSDAVLFINGNRIKDWNYRVDYQEKGASCFALYVNSGAGFALRNFHIQEWDGGTDLTEKKETADTKDDLVVFVNGDQVSGIIESIAEEQMKLKTSFATMDIPLERIQRMLLKTEGRAEAEGISGTSVLQLTNGDKLNLTIKRYDSGGLIGDSEAFGEVRFKPDSLSGLTLQVNDKRHQKTQKTSSFFDN